MAPLIVCVDGLIGTGKSTLLKRLAKDYECFPEPVEEWTLLPHLYENFSFYGQLLQFQVLISQFRQRQSFPDGLVVVERSPWTSRNVFVPLIEFEEDVFSAYDKLYRFLNYDVDYFIYLDVDPLEAFRRIENRSSVDSLISLEYLRRLRDSYVSNLLAGRSNVFVVDAGNPEDVEREVREILAKINF